MSSSGERARLLTSLAEIRGFLTLPELERGAPTPHEPLADEPFERLMGRDRGRAFDEGPGTPLDQVCEFRVEVAARSIAGLPQELLEDVAREAEIPAAALLQAQAGVVATLSAAAADERASGLDAFADSVDISGLIAPLRRRGRWPGDPAEPHVRAYMSALADSVAQHARLAFWAASRWFSNPPRLVLLLALDGLTEAIERYDARRGARLSTYAPSWIRQRIQRGFWSAAAAIRKSDQLRLRLQRLRRLAQIAVIREGRAPSHVELLQRSTDDALGPPESAYLLNPPSDVWEVRRPDGEPEYEHLFFDQSVTPGHAATRRRLLELVQGVTFKKERYRQILLRRYPLGKTAPGDTLETIGESFGVTRERIRQVEDQALDLLARMLGRQLAQLR